LTRDAGGGGEVEVVDVVDFTDRIRLVALRLRQRVGVT
jgi:hypothetical protein